MKRYAVAAIAGVISLLAIAAAASPCQAQFMKQLGQELLGGQGQNQLPGVLPGQQNTAGFGQMQSANLVGTVNLPQGQYMMTNLQTNQAFYVTVQNGQMFFSNGGDQSMQQTMPGTQALPQQQGGLGGLVKNGLGSFLNNQLQKQQQPPQ
ncbi:MAG: hypothetical protein JSS86_22370 [Cyanobacteria bacterium SZAS LIN-2]|nr:hypothetical protein [Cyanobacteria bacterium SZAS LIN-3]MBS1999095.1 hypothetical protein [Cyanobacteria bacterium SZAS LIN-2]MBS2008866.1 hypothetical protein [Cyanobacteria bacterium SZAS TMP-1]